MWRCLRASTLWHISENARCLISVVESKGHPRVSRFNACILFIESSLFAPTVKGCFTKNT